MRKLKSIPKIGGVNTRAGTLKVFHEMTSRSMLATTLVLLIFASIIAIGVVYNTAMIALSERAFELGSLRILGFKKREVFSILAGELTILTIVALPIGCLTGYFFAYLMFSSGTEYSIFECSIEYFTHDLWNCTSYNHCHVHHQLYYFIFQN